LEISEKIMKINDLRDLDRPRLTPWPRRTKDKPRNGFATKEHIDHKEKPSFFGNFVPFCGQFISDLPHPVTPPRFTLQNVKELTPERLTFHTTMLGWECNANYSFFRRGDFLTEDSLF
jgi:hypothetical protein